MEARTDSKQTPSMNTSKNRMLSLCNQTRRHRTLATIIAKWYRYEIKSKKIFPKVFLATQQFNLPMPALPTDHKVPSDPKNPFGP